MKIMSRVTIWALLVFAFTVLIFTSSRVEAAEGKIPVFVSIVPQKFFVEQIGRDRVDVQVMVEPGASPHTYEPKPQQMRALSKARVYFAIGLPFEHVWLGKIAAANRDMKIVHTDEGIEKIQMVGEHHHEGEAGEQHRAEPPHKPDGAKHTAEPPHKPAGERDSAEEHHRPDGEPGELHGEPDPHIWLSPGLVAIQAEQILNGLKAVDPSSAALYESNYRTFISQITALDGELKEIFAGKQGVQFMVFHPSWGYFAREYKLKELPIEMEGKDPKPAQIQELISHAREHKISVIFVQPQFSVKSAHQIAKEINGEVVFADPLAYDWFKNLREVADKFKAALR